MSRRQLKNEVRRSAPLHLVGLALTLVIVCSFIVGPATAQHRTFTAKPITGGRVISAAKRDLPKRSSQAPIRSVTSRKGAAKGVVKALAAVPCDVTIAAGSSPAGGYLPLSGFSIPPVAGVSDDSITNFTTPAYTFAGETYSQIGFSSNGYAIIGGSSDPGDNTLINQSFPDATVPNNVLAPFWTDLNPEAGGTLTIGELTDGTDTWIVLDWEAVSEFSITNQNSFEIWIGINSDTNPAEDISYAYGTIQGSGNGGFLSVGAENKTGTRGQNYYHDGSGTLPANGTQLRVTTTSCLATKPWTTAGSTGAIDDDSLASAAVTNFVLGFKPGTTGTITARYNITPTKDLSRFCPATSSRISLRFRDEDDVGGAAQVLLTIHQTNIASGGDTTIFTFDSNVSSQPAGSAFQTFTTEAPIDFDFSTSVYWIDARVSRSNANAFVNLGSIQIFESAGTACP